MTPLVWVPSAVKYRVYRDRCLGVPVKDSVRKASYQGASIALVNERAHFWRLRMLSTDASSELKNSSPVRLYGPHTMHRLPRRPVQLLVRRPGRRPWDARTRRFTSSHASPHAGFFVRFAFLRSSSCRCQSWTGTDSGVAARSSHRSSTS